MHNDQLHDLYFHHVLEWSSQERNGFGI